MNNFWVWLTNAMRFTGVTDKTVWQDTIISSILIGSILLPITLFLFKKSNKYFFTHKPLYQLFQGFLSSNLTTLIFLSQLKALDDTGKVDQNPFYEIHFPMPHPNNKNNLGVVQRFRIDPVWSEGDGECLAEAFNVLGSAGKVSNIQVADTIRDWSKYNNPIITIGFNPKTKELEKICHPIYYRQLLKNIKLGNTTVPVNYLSIPHTRKSLSSLLPNDAGIIQKTFIKDSGTPVFILAGLGTMGTSVTSYILNKHAINLGKLYGNAPFCVLIHVNTFGGRTTGTIKSIYPNPTQFRKIIHFLVFYNYKQKGIFK